MYIKHFNNLDNPLNNLLDHSQKKKKTTESKIACYFVV